MKPKIAVIGSANMDLVVTVDRAPLLGETVAGRTFHIVPGGKGANQALAAARAGAVVAFLGAVGADAHGDEISALLAADGVDIDGLATTADQPTGTAHIVVDGAGGNAIVVVPGANGTVTKLTDQHRAAIERSDILLLQLELPPEVVTAAAAFARSVDVTTVLTPSPAGNFPPDLLDNVAILVANEHEAVQLGGVDDMTEAARKLAGNTRRVIVTLGSQGSLLVTGDDVVTTPAFAAKAVDTTAAGDTFVGTLATAMLEDKGDADAIWWASAAAALCVQRVGASSSMPWRAEIDEFLDRHQR